MSKDWFSDKKSKVVSFAKPVAAPPTPVITPEVAEDVTRKMSRRGFAQSIITGKRMSSSGKKNILG